MVDNSNEKIADDIRVAHDRVSKKVGEQYASPKKEPRWLFEYWSEQKLFGVLRNILEKYCDIKKVVVLDAGCGVGKWSREMINIGVKKVVAVDFSEEGLRTAKKIANNENYQDKLMLIKGNLENLNFFHENTFDVIFCMGVIEHLDNPKKVFEEFGRVVKDNGIIIEWVPRTWSLTYITFMLYGQNPKYWGSKKDTPPFSYIREKARYYRFYSYTKVRRIIESVKNFRIIEKYPATYIWVQGKPRWYLEYICKKLKNRASCSYI